MNACYPDTIYRRLAAGELENPTYQDCESHIQSCDKCQVHLQSLILLDQGEVATSYPVIPGFTIQAKLGEGGMGVVYLAWQVELERHVAIKVVSDGPFPDAGARKRWLNEARSLSRVVHPHVVQIHQVSEETVGLFLVLEYVSGGNLKDRLGGKPLPPRVAGTILEKQPPSRHPPSHRCQSPNHSPPPREIKLTRNV